MSVRKTNWVATESFLKVFQEAFLGVTCGEDGWGNQYFHISDATSCSRRIYYRMLFARHPEERERLGHKEEYEFAHQMTFFIGHAVHERLQHFFVEKMHWCTWDDVEVRVTFADGEGRGSVDVVIPISRFYEVCDELGIPEDERPYLEGSHFVLDIKTKADKVEITRDPKEGKRSTHTFPADIMRYPSKEYTTQVLTYIDMLSEQYPERYPDIKLAIILYACKNNGEAFAVGLEREDGVGAFVEAKARTILKHLEDGVPPAREYPKKHGKCCGWVNNGELEYPCPYYAICHGG